MSGAKKITMQYHNNQSWFESSKTGLFVLYQMLTQLNLRDLLMSRKLLITIHLYLAAFFAPILIITAISGGLYLLGLKGSVEKKLVYTGAATEINVNAEDMKLEVSNVLSKAGIDADFEYVKGGGDFFFTRPTSKQHYVLEIENEQLKITKRTPDLNKVIVELHKGHGPLAFKTFQKILAAGLIFIVVSGLWLGLSSPQLRSKSIIASGLGGLIFLLLALT